MLVDHRIVAKRAPEPGAYHSEPAGAGDSDPEGPRITVILTTIEGPLAALRAAINLARGLRAEIVLVAEVVYFRYPLEHPPMESSFFERLGTALVDELDLAGNAVDLEIHFCRDQLRCLEQSLPPRSLVMIGAKKKCRWRGRERKLERALGQRGHDVVWVRASAKPGEEHEGWVIDHLLRGMSAPGRAL